MKPVDLELTVSEDGETLLTGGDLEFSSKAAFAEHLAAHLARRHTSGRPHLDLMAVEFMDSAGMEALLWAHKQLAARGEKLHIRVRTGSQPAKILRLSQFHRIYHIEFA